MVVYPEGDWKYFKGKKRKPYFFMCKSCSQIHYYYDSDSWSKTCRNCESKGKFMPIILETVVDWMKLTNGWFKEEVVAQLIESPIIKHRRIGEVFYKAFFVDGSLKL